MVHFVVILLRLPGQHLWALAALELGRFVPKFLVVLSLVDVNGLDRDGPVLALLALEGLELRVVVVCLLGPGLVTNPILASWLFEIKDLCKKSEVFSKTHNQGLRQQCSGTSA